MHILSNYFRNFCLFWVVSLGPFLSTVHLLLALVVPVSVGLYLCASSVAFCSLCCGAPLFRCCCSVCCCGCRLFVVCPCGFDACGLARSREHVSVVQLLIELVSKFVYVFRDTRTTGDATFRSKKNSPDGNWRPHQAGGPQRPVGT